MTKNKRESMVRKQSSNKQSIIRVKKEECPYVQVDKRTLEDTCLSWKAKGILSFLLSRPPNWKVIPNDLKNRSKDGRESVYSGLKELKENNYALFREFRSENGNFLYSNYVIFERPENKYSETETYTQTVAEETDFSSFRSIFNIEKRVNPFVQISNDLVEDDRLSWKAKALLCYLLSRPDDWKIIKADLVNKATDGLSSVNSGIEELVRWGYATREEVRSEKGMILCYDYIIREHPLLTKENSSSTSKPVNGKSTGSKPVNGKTVNRKPVSGKTSPTNKEVNNNDCTKKEHTNIDDFHQEVDDIQEADLHEINKLLNNVVDNLSLENDISENDELNDKTFSLKELPRNEDFHQNKVEEKEINEKQPSFEDNNSNELKEKIKLLEEQGVNIDSGMKKSLKI